MQREGQTGGALQLRSAHTHTHTHGAAAAAAAAAAAPRHETGLQSNPPSHSTTTGRCSCHSLILSQTLWLDAAETQRNGSAGAVVASHRLTRASIQRPLPRSSPPRAVTPPARSKPALGALHVRAALLPAARCLLDQPSTVLLPSNPITITIIHLGCYDHWRHGHV